MHIKYRPEIDGLRAVAVLAVVFYHAKFVIHNIEIFKGGFIGVDIFFVISGYLITFILLSEMKEDSFTFLGFYERRARRILPALFTIIFVSIPLAWIYMLPEAFKEYAGSVFSTIFFGSNFFFLLEDSYTAEISEYKPLLHTWSLAIEEQFYVLYPIFLLFCYKNASKHLTKIIIFGLLLSLFLSDWSSARYVDANFYLLPTRAWELLAGALLAELEIDKSRVNYPILEKIMPVIGAICIIYSFLYFNDQIRHPSLLTLIPIIGVMLIIRFSSKEDLVTKILSFKAIIFIGLVSYSLYLWHYLIFAFVRIRSSSVLSNYEKLECILLSFVLAIFTWFFIEKTTRNRRLVSANWIWKISLAGSIVLFSFSLYGVLTEGISSRLSNRLPNFIKAEDSKPIRQNGRDCRNIKENQKPCEFNGRKHDGFTIIITGDSHMATFNGPMLDASDKYSKFVPLTHNACLYIIGVERVNEKNRACSSSSNEWRQKIILNYKKPLVIIGGRYPLQIESSRFDNKEGGVEIGKYSHPRLVNIGGEWSEPAPLSKIKKSLSSTVSKLLKSGVKVVLIYPIPEVGWHVPMRMRQLVSGMIDKREINDILDRQRISTSFEVFKMRTIKSYEVLDFIPDHENLIRIYPEELFCDDERCYAHKGISVYYIDDDHLSYTGANILLNKIFEEISAKFNM